MKGRKGRQMILAGIVTYNPDIDRLRECIDAVLPQVDKVLVFDNASTNIEQVLQIVGDYQEGVILHMNGVNAGVAAALSEIMEYALDNGYDWVLSMDQDSVLQSGIIDVYKRAIKRCPNAGMFTCLIKDRNFTDMKNESQRAAISAVPYCITAGALTNVKAYAETEGYDKSFFIDGVDFDICYSLREKGYRIYRVKRLGVLQEVGHGENRWLLWKRIVIYNESPDRVYYMARNKVKLFKKHKEYGLYTLLTKEAGHLFRICFYEKEKKEKIRNFFRGLIDGMRK